MSKTTFIVIANHTFGTVNPAQPDILQILASKPQRGATHNWMDGLIALPSTGTRPATRADFEDFRISSKGYAEDTAHYEFPAA